MKDHDERCASLHPAAEKLCNCGVGHPPGSLAAEWQALSGRDPYGRVTNMPAAVAYDLGRVVSAVLAPPVYMVEVLFRWLLNAADDGRRDRSP